MALIQIKKSPSRRDLFWFGLLLFPFFALVGGLIWTWAIAIWGVGALLGGSYWLCPRIRRPVYLAWIYATFPIGWVVSHLALGVTFFLVVTPIGLIMRLCGRDPMHRRFDSEVESYWVPHAPAREMKRYFHQY